MMAGCLTGGHAYVLTVDQSAADAFLNCCGRFLPEHHECYDEELTDKVV
jgi:hypothetical protein